jgi:hypothetical protein
MSNVNDVWDSQLVGLKAIEKKCLMEEFGPEEGLKLFEKLNSENYEPPEDYDKVDFDAIDAEMEAELEEFIAQGNYVVEE